MSQICENVKYIFASCQNKLVKCVTLWSRYYGNFYVFCLSHYLIILFLKRLHQPTVALHSLYCSGLAPLQFISLNHISCNNLIILPLSLNLFCTIIFEIWPASYYSRHTTFLIANLHSFSGILSSSLLY